MRGGTPGDELARRVATLPPHQRALLLQRLRRRPPASSASERAIVRGREVPGARLRLFCFPYAGGGASAFRSWADAVAPDVEVCAVQPPGREARIGEPAHRRLTPLVTELADAIEPYLDRPFAFFGHSMGALVAFELARQLRRTSRPQPVRLSVAAFRAPQLPRSNVTIHDLPDDLFTALLRSEGVPEAILRDEEVRRAMFPTLRADFELCATYEHTPEPPLGCAISAYAGAEDPRVSAAEMAGWSVHGTGACRTTVLPGSHFFVHTAQHRLLAEIGRDVATDRAPRERCHV